MQTGIPPSSLVTIARDDDHVLFDTSISASAKMTKEKACCCLVNGSLHGGWRTKMNCLCLTRCDAATSLGIILQQARIFQDIISSSQKLFCYSGQQLGFHNLVFHFNQSFGDNLQIKFSLGFTTATALLFGETRQPPS